MIMPDYVDIHSHLNFPDYDKDRDVVIERMKSANIHTITVGTNLETSKSAVDLANKHDNIFACIGLHPVDDEDSEQFIWDEKQFGELANQEKVVAIGECGLDYLRLLAGDESKKKKQKEIFEAQISLALKIGKPLMIHCRDAYEDVLDVLQNFKREVGDKLVGNVHFFAGNVDVAKKFLDIGFTMSFTGVITFVDQYNEVIDFLPLDSIMSETDAPFVAPKPHRGKRNEPTYVIEVVRAISAIKKLDEGVVGKALVANAVRCFGLK